MDVENSKPLKYYKFEEREKKVLSYERQPKTCSVVFNKPNNQCANKLENTTSLAKHMETIQMWRNFPID